MTCCKLPCCARDNNDVSEETLPKESSLAVDYDQACLPLYKEFLKECKELKETQSESNVLDFARTLQNLVQIHTELMVMADEVQEEGKFLVFDKLYADSEACMTRLYKKLPQSGLA
jgi:hypothetical protein